MEIARQMPVDRWQRVQELFDEALAKPQAERDVFLQDVCRDDVDLLQEVSTLLAHDSAIDDAFLDGPQPPPRALPLDAAHTADALLGRKIGGYAIQAVIGRGGMSTVYEALQDNPRRLVALKVMKAGYASPSALRRFQHEAQLLARLLHPNIAQVYEAGSHEAILYFAMERVPGARTLIDYANDESLGIRERLDLLAQVCDAVQHGHQRSIIHRDLKPANILVDSNGQVKVIDFGVARATDSDLAVTTMHTGVGDLVGTLQYMSPEQCDADPHELDVRTDVYSLGVILYELLVGAMPYDSGGTSIYRATRVIKEMAPTRPSSVKPRLRGDIETILLKALEKDRDRRYPSAADLARDIRHHLQREPIEARPPTPWVAFIRWIARHPILTTAASCLLIGLFSLIGTWATVWFYYQDPHRIEIDEDSQVARLFSRGGMELANWEAPAPGSIPAALLVDVPEEFGGGKFAVVGYGVSPAHDRAGQVCAYRVSDGRFDDPVWCRWIELDDMPDALTERGQGSNLAGVCGLFLADVFQNIPGDEIVVIHCFGSSGVRTVRVLDLQGVVRYQVWHNGHIGAWHWMKGERLLVLAGDNCGGQWSDRGQPHAKNIRPYVVWALRPTLDFRSNQFVFTFTGDSPLHPAWYRCLHYPFSEVLVGDLRLSVPTLSPDADQQVSLVFYLDKVSHAGVDWAIDADGQMVPGTRAGNDHYYRDTSYPPLEAFTLGDLPPIIPQTETPSPPAESP